MRGSGGTGADGLAGSGRTWRRCGSCGGRRSGLCAMISGRSAWRTSEAALPDAAAQAAGGAAAAGVDGFAAVGAGGVAGATGTLATGRATALRRNKTRCRCRWCRGLRGGGGAAAARAVSPALLSTGGAAGGAGGGAGWRHGLLLFGDQLKHIAGLGDVREINLGLDFVSFADCARLGGRGLGFGGGAEMSAHLFRFVSSTELECVFFSVTPTSTRTSRIALLLTSSSLARSLIRILLIRPFLAPPPLPKSS